MPTLPEQRRKKCPTCGAPRGNRCRNATGAPVAWHHADRLNAVDTDKRGAPLREIPAEVRAAIAAGTPMREVARTSGIARSTLLRHFPPGTRPTRSESVPMTYPRPTPPPVRRPATPREQVARAAAKPSAPVQRLTEEFGTLMTVAEVAALLKVSKMTVYRLEEIGDLGGVRVGRSVRIAEDSVRRYLAAGGSDQDIYQPAPKRRRPLVSVAR